MIKRSALIAALSMWAVAQTAEIPLNETRLTVHTLLREDIFAGFMANDMKRFSRGQENITKLMELRPEQKGNLLAWKGGGLLYRAVRAYETKQQDEFEKLYRQSLEAFTQS